MKFELTTLEEYTDEALLAELRRVADAIDGQRLTRERFNSLAKVSSSTLDRHFGGWAKALDKAGVSETVAPRFHPLSRELVLQSLREFIEENPGKSVTEQQIAARLGRQWSKITGHFGKWQDLLAEVGLNPVPSGRRYTEDECFENILVLWTHYGRQPSFSELKRPPSAVGPKAYVGRWGGWRAALSAFVKQVNATSLDSPVELTPSPLLPGSCTTEASVSTPRSIALGLRYKVLVRDKFRCVLCGASPAKESSVELHIDHIHPWSRGGQNIEDNLRTLCSKCNLGKGATIEVP